MSRTARPTAVTALVATALVVPFGLLSVGTARAETPAPLVVFGQDQALVRSDPALSTGSQTVISPAANADLHDLDASADGSRFVHIAVTPTDASGSEDPVHTRVVARDAGGQVVRVLDDRTLDFSTFTGSIALRPALSSTGSNAAWSAVSFDTGHAVIKTAPVSSGAAVSVPGSTDLFFPQYVTDGTFMVSTDLEGGVLKTLPVAGGTATAVSGLAGTVNTFAVSPDGSRIAYSTAAAASTDPDSLWSAPLTHTGTTWTVGTPVLLTSDFETLEDGPSFSHDNGTVYWSQTTSDTDSDVYSVSAAGGTPTDLTNTPAKTETSVAGVQLDDGTAPGSATALPFVLNGTTATIRWTLPTDSDLSGVKVTRTLGSSIKTVYVPAPLTSFVDTGLVLGQTYTYDIVAVDRSDNSAPASTRLLTASQPRMTFYDPTSGGGTQAPFRLTLPAGHYTVQYRTNSTGALATLPQHLGTTYVFSAAHAGYSYGFAIQSLDTHGNSSAVVGAGYATVPYDQTRASFTGTTATQALSDRWLGSATILKTAGSAARMTINGNRLQIIGERCASCGVMDVYLDGKRVVGIDTHAAGRQARQVLYTRALSPGNHSMVIKARGTAHRPNVVLDGFAVRH